MSPFTNFHNDKATVVTPTPNVDSHKSAPLQLPPQQTIFVRTVAGCESHSSGDERGAAHYSSDDDMDLWVPVGTIQSFTDVTDSVLEKREFSSPDDTFSLPECLAQIRNETEVCLSSYLNEGRSYLASLTSHWNSVCGGDTATDSTKQWLTEECFPRLRKPYGLVLFLISRCRYIQQGFDKGKNTSLAAILLDAFREWINKCQNPRTTSEITLDMKRFAFASSFSALPSFCQKMAAIYLLSAPPDNRHFLPFVEQLVRNHRFREAALCATIIGQPGCLDMREVLIPLMVQDKIQVIEEYISLDETLQREFISLVDNFYASALILLERELEERKIPDVRTNNVKKPFFKKLVTRLAKKYNVSVEHYPSVSEGQASGYLHFLVTTLLKGTQPGESFQSIEELIQKHVGSSLALQKDFIGMLDYRGAHEESYIWSKRFGFIQSDNEECTYDSYDSEESRNSEDFDDHYYSLPSHLYDNVVVVNTLEKLFRSIEDLQIVPKIGIDVEWCPLHTQDTQSLATLQLASHEQVYIIDFIALGDYISDPEVWLPLGNLLRQPNILKLGYELNEDLRHLHTTLPTLLDHPHHQDNSHLDYKSLFDLKVVSKLPQFHAWLTDFTGSTRVAKGDGNVSGGGLSGLVERCFGRPLNKREQMSDWERRPLRRAQIRYAGLDAYCLIEIHDWLDANRCPEDLYHPNVTFAWDPNPVKKKKRKPKSKRLEEDAEKESLPMSPMAALLANQSVPVYSPEDHWNS